jgi:hypothetical protein
MYVLVREAGGRWVAGVERSEPPVCRLLGTRLSPRPQPPGRAQPFGVGRPAHKPTRAQPLGRVARDEHAVDALAVHVDDLQPQAVPIDRIADQWDVAELGVRMGSGVRKGSELFSKNSSAPNGINLARNSRDLRDLITLARAWNDRTGKAGSAGKNVGVESTSPLPETQPWRQVSLMPWPRSSEAWPSV